MIEGTSTDPRLFALFRALDVLFRGDLRGLHIADLACLEGGFSAALAQRGAQVLGIEARADSLARANALKQRLGLVNLDFVQGDVKDFTVERFGHFDAVMAFGILYHLDRPVEWLAQIAAAARGALLVDTHYAPESDAEVANLEVVGPGGVRVPLTLGPLQQVSSDGRVYAGRSFFEYAEGQDPEPLSWSAYSNPTSLWLTRESLLLALLHSGCDVLFEQHDYTVERHRYFHGTYFRALFVAVKSAYLVRARSAS
jgi:SAM-dependent methyltransferase